jgi:hypothetical protein
MPARGTMLERLLGPSLPVPEMLSRVERLRAALAEGGDRLSTLQAEIEATERRPLLPPWQRREGPSLARALGRIPLAPRSRGATPRRP